MLNFEQIKEYFDAAAIERNPKGLLVEYLQYEFLDSLFKQAGAENLCFIGGTAIRIVHGSQRFSEDLDFDNFGLNYEEFKHLMNKTCSEIKLKGFEIESRLFKKEKVFHCYIKFPDLLFKYGIPAHRNEKIFLGVDSERKKKTAAPEVANLNRFGIFRDITASPAPVLLAMKLVAILSRRRAQGRDFYDASFLSGKTKPDYDYIKKTSGLDKAAFSKKVMDHCARLNYKSLAKDVEPILFNSSDAKRVLMFKDHLPAILG